MKTLLVLCLTTLGWWSRPAPTTAPQNAEADILAVVNRLIDALNRGDSAMARTTFHPRARLITLDLRNRGGDSARIEESAEGFIQSLGRPRTEVFREELSDVKTMFEPGFASVWANYKFFRGTTLSHCGVDHFLLVKERDAWKIIELADTRRRVNC